LTGDAGGTTIGAEFMPLAAWGHLMIIDDIAYLRKPRDHHLRMLSDSLQKPRLPSHATMGLHVDGVSCSRRILVSG